MVLDLFKLHGKTAIVTGAGRGLGQSMALGLAEAGADLVLVGRSDGIDDTRKKAEALGRKAISVRADLSKLDAIPHVMQKTLEAFGKVDILVNNAGIVRRAPVLEFTEKDWDDVVDLNLKSCFFMAQAAARDMVKRRKGKIINVSSITFFWGATRIPAYAASKGGVSQFTKSLCNELAKYGINVNAIAPGYMATDINKDLRSDAEKSAELLSRIPAGRYGDPDELKGLTVYLASEASNYMNGTTVVMDGGWMAR
ncbi:MAG TPA: glucose 1-dehydrogenase [Planctomycetota bacterium]|nr:glucose 1-dehydrogenase [Planctomycetota bacterium]